MSLFGNNHDQNNGRPKNPDAYMGFRMLAAGYLLYLTWDVIKLYRAGGADKPSLPLLIFSLLFLGGGAIFIAVITWKQWKRWKREAEEEAAAAAQAEEELPESLLPPDQAQEDVDVDEDVPVAEDASNEELLPPTPPTEE